MKPNPVLGALCLATALGVGAASMLAFTADVPLLGALFLVSSIALLGAAAVHVADEDR